MAKTKTALLGLTLLLSGCSFFGSGEKTAAPATPPTTPPPAATSQSGAAASHPAASSSPSSTSSGGAVPVTSSSSSATSTGSDIHAPRAPLDRSYLSVISGASGQGFDGMPLEVSDALSSIDAKTMKQNAYAGLPPNTEGKRGWRGRLPNKDVLALLTDASPSATGSTLYLYSAVTSSYEQFTASSSTILYDWAGDNILVASLHTTESGGITAAMNRFSLFDANQKTFVNVPAYGYLGLEKPVSTLHFLDNPTKGNLFALSFCTDQSIAGDCREYDIALSNSAMIRDVATIPSSNGIEWGWKDDKTFFVRQLSKTSSGSIYVMDTSKLKWEESQVPTPVIKPSIAERYRTAQESINARLSEDDRKAIYAQLESLPSSTSPNGDSDALRTLFTSKGLSYTEDNILVITSEGSKKLWGQGLDIERALLIDKQPIDAVIGTCLEKSATDAPVITTALRSRYPTIPDKISDRDFCLMRIASQNLGALDADASFREKYMPANIILPAPSELGATGSGSYGPMILLSETKTDTPSADGGTETGAVRHGSFAHIDVSSIVDAEYRKAVCEAVGKTSNATEKTKCLKLMVNTFDGSDPRYALMLCNGIKDPKDLPKKCASKESPETRAKYSREFVARQKQAAAEAPVTVVGTIDVIFFDLTFNNHPGSDGSVRLYLNDEQFATVYERLTPKGTSTFEARFEPKSAGSYTLKIAADGMDPTVKSEASISHVQAGLHSDK